MPRARTVDTKSGGRGRSLAQVYRRFGEGDGAKISPLYGRIAVALSESAEALRVIESAPGRKRHPTIVLAALHDLVLAGETPALAAAFAAAGNAETLEAGIDGVRAPAVEALVGNAGAVLERLDARKVRADEGGGMPCCTRRSARSRGG